VDIDDDESFDVAAFEQLRELIIPTLGSNAVPSTARKAVANSLFQTSIVHPLAPGDRLALRDGVEAALDALKKPRAGRTTAVYPARRQRMAYVAFNELFSQSFANPATDQATEADLRIRIANVMAPFLVVRTALALRMYIADQPLRGRMPQPLSQRKELMWMLRKVVEMKGEKGGLSRLGGEEAESKRHLLHVYPLLVQAQRVTADEKVTMLLREAMEAVGQELGL
jgi:hypothetical protein